MTTAHTEQNWPTEQVDLYINNTEYFYRLAIERLDIALEDMVEDLGPFPAQGIAARVGEEFRLAASPEWGEYQDPIWVAFLEDLDLTPEEWAEVDWADALFTLAESVVNGEFS